MKDEEIGFFQFGNKINEKTVESFFVFWVWHAYYSDTDWLVVDIELKDNLLIGNDIQI